MREVHDFDSVRKQNTKNNHQPKQKERQILMQSRSLSLSRNLEQRSRSMEEQFGIRRVSSSISSSTFHNRTIAANGKHAIDDGGDDNDNCKRRTWRSRWTVRSTSNRNQKKNNKNKKRWIRRRRGDVSVDEGEEESYKIYESDYTKPFQHELDGGRGYVSSMLEPIEDSMYEFLCGLEPPLIHNKLVDERMMSCMLREEDEDDSDDGDFRMLPREIEFQIAHQNYFDQGEGTGQNSMKLKRVIGLKRSFSHNSSTL